MWVVLTLGTINTINFNCWFVPPVILISSVFIVAGSRHKLPSLLCASCLAPWERLSAINVHCQFIIRLRGDKTGCQETLCSGASRREKTKMGITIRQIPFPPSIHRCRAPSRPVLELRAQRGPICRSWRSLHSISLCVPMTVITSSVWSEIRPSPPAALIEPHPRRSGEVSSSRRSEEYYRLGTQITDLLPPPQLLAGVRAWYAYTCDPCINPDLSPSSLSPVGFGGMFRLILSCQRNGSWSWCSGFTSGLRRLWPSQPLVIKSA